MKWIESVWKSFRLLWFTKRQIFDIDNEPSTSVSHTAWGFLYILEVTDFKQTMFSRTCVRNILLSALFSIRQYVQSDNTCPTYGFRCVSSFPILFQYLVISFFNRLEFKFSCDRWNRKFRPRFEDFMIIIKASIFTACDQARGTNIKKRTTGRHTNTIQ